MSASLRKRPNCCIAAKCRSGPLGDVVSASSRRSQFSTEITIIREPTNAALQLFVRYLGNSQQKAAQRLNTRLRMAPLRQNMPQNVWFEPNPAARSAADLSSRFGPISDLRTTLRLASAVEEIQLQTHSRHVIGRLERGR
jgi:hypothetical protein